MMMVKPYLQTANHTYLSLSGPKDKQSDRGSKKTSSWSHKLYGRKSFFKRSFKEKCAMRQHLQQKRKFFSAAHQRNRAQPQYCISQCEYFKSTSLLKYFTDSNDRTSLNLWNQVTWRTQKSQLWQKSSIEMKEQHTTHWNWKHPCC